MFKKIFTLLVSASIALSAVPCSVHALSTDSNKNEVLKALDIIDGKLPSKVTYNDFVKALMNIVLGGVKTNPETFVGNYGLIESGKVYKGKDAMTVAEAVKYAVIVAGYDVMVKDKTIDGYLSVASVLDLLDGVGLSGNETLTAEAATEILYNLLEVNPVMMNNGSYETQNDKDMLGVYKSIYYHKGIVTANEYTAVNDTEGASENMIQINGEDFDIEIPYDENLLGKWVEVYVRETRGDDPSIIYVGTLDSKNEILEIEAEDINSVASDFSRIDYYTNDGNKANTAKLAKNLKVIYNGEFYGSYTVEDLKPEIGKIELLSNDDDKVYDIVKVTSYQTMLVEGVNLSENIITNKYEFNDCLDYIILEDNDVDYTIIKAENNIKISGISAGDVLSVAKTKNENDVRYKIYVSSDTLQGNVIGVDNTEKEISIGEEKYSYTPEYEKQLAYKGQSVELGKEYQFYLDVFGNIVYSVKQAEADYCLLYRVYRDEDTEEVYAKYLTYDNEWQNRKIKTKVKYTNASGVSSTVDSASLYKVLSKEDPQVVKLKTNKNSEVSEITLPYETSAYMEGVFTKSPSITQYYRSGAGTFDNKLYLFKNAKMFVMPETPTKNMDDYYVQSTAGQFSGDHQYTLTAFDMDDFGYTGLILIKEDSSYRTQRMSNSMYVVEKFGKQLSDDGEVCTKITVSGSGLKGLTFLTDDDSILEGVEVGDVINFALDKYGMISQVREVATLNGAFSKQNNSYFYTTSVLLKGTVANIDLEGGRIKLDCGSSIAFPLSSNVKCLSYDGEDKECELIYSYDLVKGDNLVVRVSWSKIEEIIRVEK